MSILSKLAGIERDAGAMSMFLQCGEYDYKELKSNLQNLQELLEQLAELRSSNEDWLESNQCGTRKYSKIEQQTGAMEDAEYALGEAEDLMRDLCKRPKALLLPGEIACCLDRACQYLTEAVEVNV